MIELPEAGYTPANLRKLMGYHEISTRSLAGILGKHETAVYRWRLDPDDPKFSSMNHADWIRLLEYLEHLED